MAEVICIDTPATCDGRNSLENNAEKFEAAVQAASKLADDCGKGYRGKVWENLGWHYRAVSPCGRVEVYYSAGYGKKAKPSYSISIHEPGGNGTSAAFGHMPDRSTPKSAIDAGVAQVRRYINTLNDLVEGL
jgi:hypothetical protein